ncbi:MAG: hypothetical protein WBQ43_12395 [Terriglobales bacterium]
MTTFNSANTSDWLEVMKNQSISSDVPSNYCIAEPPIFTSVPVTTTQTTVKGLEIPVPTSEQFLGDLTKASRKTK